MLCSPGSHHRQSAHDSITRDGPRMGSHYQLSGRVFVDQDDERAGALSDPGHCQLDVQRRPVWFCLRQQFSERCRVGRDGVSRLGSILCSGSSSCASKGDSQPSHPGGRSLLQHSLTVPGAYTGTGHPGQTPISAAIWCGYHGIGMVSRVRLTSVLVGKMRTLH